MDKKIRNLIIVIIINVLTIITAAHATIVKVNHSNLLINLTPVAASSQDAYSKCVKDKSGVLKVNASIEKISNQLQAIIKENAIPYDTGNMNTMNTPQNMPSKGELKKMTREEKIALAMKMQSQMNTNNAPKNTEAWSKCIELNNKFTKMMSEDTLTSKLFELKTRYETEHGKIDSETEKALKSCPMISSGEMSAPDSKCVKAKKLDGAEKHIVLAGKELAELRAILNTQTSKIKGLITDLDKLMKDVNYGEGLEDSNSKTMLNQAQGLALQQISQIQAIAQESYTKAGAWIVAKQRIAEMY